MSGPVTAYVALGSNLGDRLASIHAAVDALRQAEGVEVVAVSPLIETAPVGGPPGQGPYLNAACALRTTLGPRDLLSLLLRIEAGQGRTRRQRWEARPIDLDLLLHGDLVIDEPGLHIPHPRMHERPFVLDPLSMIAPHAMHPVLRRRIAEIRAAITRPQEGPSASPSG